MRAEDLMIGDWIAVQPKRPKNKEVYERVNIETLDVMNTLPDEANNAFFKPITLTPEILELNGVEYDDRFVGECYTICGTAGRCLVWNNISKSLSIGPFTLCKCEYVHQLQHILRDCGMGVDITKVEESK